MHKPCRILKEFCVKVRIILINFAEMAPECSSYLVTLEYGLI